MTRCQSCSCALELLLELGQAGAREVDPAQIGFDVEQAVVAHQDLKQVRVLFQAGQLTHAGHVFAALHIEQPVGVVVEQ